MHASRSILLGFTVLLFCLWTWTALAQPGSGDRPASATTRLPQAPPGCQVREVVSFLPQDQEPVRIAAHPATGHLYVLGGGGDVTEVDPVTQTKRRLLRGEDY